MDKSILKFPKKFFFICGDCHKIRTCTSLQHEHCGSCNFKICPACVRNYKDEYFDEEQLFCKDCIHREDAYDSETDYSDYSTEADFPDDENSFDENTNTSALYDLAIVASTIQNNEMDTCLTHNDISDSEETQIDTDFCGHQLSQCSYFDAFRGSCTKKFCPSMNLFLKISHPAQNNFPFIACKKNGCTAVYCREHALQLRYYCQKHIDCHSERTL